MFKRFWGKGTSESSREPAQTQEGNQLERLLDKDNIPKHVAIIMDGNGRWAKRQGKPRTFGHHAGADTLKKLSSLQVNSVLRHLQCTPSLQRTGNGLPRK